MQSKGQAKIIKHPSATLIPRWLLGILLLLAITKLGMQLYIADKGFDIWDEGWYILIFNFFSYYPSEPHSYYGAILSKLLPIEYNLINLRILLVIFEVAGITFFSLTFFRWAQAQASEVKYHLHWFALLLLVFVGAAFTSVYTRAFSYNDLSYFSTLVAAGIVFYAFRSKSPLSKAQVAKAAIAMLVVGAVLGIQLFVKLPTSILLFGWATFFICFYASVSWRYRVLFVIAILIGGVASVLGIVGGTAGFNQWLGHLAQGVENLQLLAYDTHAIFIQGYLKVDLLENSLYYLLPLLFAATTFAIMRKWKKEDPQVGQLTAFSVGIGVWLVISISYRNAFLGEFHYRFIALHIYTLLFLGIPFFRELTKKKEWHWIGIIILLLALPFIALAGSNNPTTQTLTKYLASWHVLIVIILCYRFRTAPRVFIAFVFVIVSFSLVNYASVQLLTPYGLRQNVFHQTETVNDLSFLDGVKMDKPSAAFFEEVKATVRQTGYQAPGPILALGDLCGVVVAMGGYMPETFWYFSDENAISPQHSRNFSCLHLGNLRIREHNRLPLVMINSGIHQSVIDCLEASEVPFPEGYYLVHTIFNPYAQESLAVWAPNQWNIP